MDTMIVEEWFKLNGKGALILPDGWFGRPRDSFYSLTFVANRPIKTILELSNKSLLIFTQPLIARVDTVNNQLVLADFAMVVFDFRNPLFPRGSDPSVKVFYDGEVRFDPP